MNTSQKFRAKLGRFAGVWRTCLFFHALLWGVIVTVGSFVVAAGLDAAFAFDEGGLKTAATLVIILGVIMFLCGLPSVFKFSRSAAARTADKEAANKRHAITSANDLADEVASGEMNDFLREKVFVEGNTTISGIPASRRLPWRSFKKPAIAALAIGALISIALVKFPEVSQTTTARLLNPNGGIAPYSPLNFKITPENPEVVYGSDLLIEVEITGGEIEHPVECLVRDTATGEIEETDSYRESSGKFAQKIGKVTNSLEIAFSTGRARSAWKRIDVLHQPRFASAKVKIAPPEYTGVADSEFALGTSELKVIEGTRIELLIESNRPLGGGDLVFTPTTENTTAEPVTVNDPQISGNTATFAWIAKGTGRVSVNLSDIRGTPSDSALEFDQRSIPDAAPDVAITEPARMVLATPKSVLPLKAETNDDYGLSKVELVRALSGFRDRAKTVGDNLTRREMSMSKEINLERIGVKPGEKLEFFVEATDRNPSLMGIGTSDVVEVTIISEEEYAERIRIQTSMEEFSQKFQEMQDQVNAARQALEELDEALESGEEEKIAKAREEAENTQEKAAEFFEKLEKDFPAFAIDERAKKVAGEIASKMNQNASDLKSLSGTPQDQRDQVKKMLERLGKTAPEMDQLAQDAKDAAAAGKVMEMTRVFREVLANQESLTKRFDTIAKELSAGNTANARQLEGLAKQQEKNRERLQYLRDELSKRAKALPESLSQTRQSAEDFVARMDHLMIGDAMEAAKEGAEDGEISTALTNSLLALKMLQQLIDKPGDQMCEMCKGNQPKFAIKEPDLAKTMEQMLAACQKGGVGDGLGAAGAGAGGGTGDGFSNFGPSMPSIPMIGPNRLRFAETGVRSNKSSGGGRSGYVESATAQDPNDGADAIRQPSEIQPDIKSVPERYRNAVKRYFTDDTAAVNETTEPGA